MAVGNAWCIGTFVGGALDALYQVSHDGKHLGTAISDWYVLKEKGVANFLHGNSQWWNAEVREVEQFLGGVYEWWQT